MIVYKYVRPERVDVLEHRMLRFTQAVALNDPFEANPCFGNLERSLIERQLQLIESQPARDTVKTAARVMIPSGVRRSLRDFQIKLGSEILVLSLTKNRNNLIMWSHYADYHKGFVLGFDSQSDFFEVHAGKLVTPLTEVKYAENRPILPTFDDFPNFSEELAEIIIFNKSIHWAYEEELRTVAHFSSADKHIKANDGSDIYLFAYPREAVREIVLGFATPDAVKERVKALVEERYPHVEVYQAQLSDTQFDLTIVPM